MASVNDMRAQFKIANEALQKMDPKRSPDERELHCASFTYALTLDTLAEWILIYGWTTWLDLRPPWWQPLARRRHDRIGEKIYEATEAARAYAKTQEP